MTQSAFSQVAGVTRKTLFGYENGDRAPDASALSRWAPLGLDVLYVVTGVRTPASTPAALPPDHLTPRERTLLDNYRNTHPAKQQFIEDAAFMASEHLAARKGCK